MANAKFDLLPTESFSTVWFLDRGPLYIVLFHLKNLETKMPDSNEQSVSVPDQEEPQAFPEVLPPFALPFFKPPTNEPLNSDFSSLPGFKVEPSSDPTGEDARFPNEQDHWKSDELQSVPRAKQIVSLSPRTQYEPSSAHEPSLGDLSSSLFDVSTILNYPFSSPYATTPRLQANGKSRTFGVLPALKTTFWNFSTFDGHLNSASLGRPKKGSTLSPFRLNQDSLLRISPANPYAVSTRCEESKSEASTVGAASVPVAELAERSRLPVYAEDQSESDDFDDRERMRAIGALLCPNTQEPETESFELRSSFNQQKRYDLRTSKDVNREMIRSYLLQRDGRARAELSEQAGERKGSPEGKQSGSPDCGKRPKKSTNRETIVDFPAAAKAGSNSLNDRCSDLNVPTEDGQTKRTHPTFKTSKYIYKSYDPNKCLSEKQMHCLKITRFVPYCFWVFISNLLLLAIFWLIL